MDQGKIPYDEVCRIIGHLYLDNYTQLSEYNKHIQDLDKENFSLKAQLSALQNDLHRKVSDK